MIQLRPKRTLMRRSINRQKLLLLMPKGVQGVPTVHRVQAPKRAQIKENPRIRAKTRKRIRVRRMRNQVLQAAQVLQVPLPVHHQ